MLILSRKTDQQIKIGDDITLTIIEIREVFSAIKSENTAALNVNTDSIGALSKMLTH